MSDYDSLRPDYDGLRSNYDSLSSNCGSLGLDCDGGTSDHDSLGLDRDGLRSDCKKFTSVIFGGVNMVQAGCAFSAILFSFFHVAQKNIPSLAQSRI